MGCLYGVIRNTGCVVCFQHGPSAWTGDDCTMYLDYRVKEFKGEIPHGKRIDGVVEKRYKIETQRTR